MAIAKLRDGKIYDIPAPKNLTAEQFDKLKVQTDKQKSVVERILRNKAMSATTK